jgi:signal transduction histidine kinase
MEGENPTDTRRLVVLRDITGIATFYEQMQRADRLAAVGTLATGIAHEIRNPLASIRGMMQLLAESTGDSANGLPEIVQAEYHHRMLKEVDRLEKLVAGIMNFAQAAHSPVEEVDINLLLREVIESAQMQSEDASASIEINWDLDEKLPRVHLQAERLRQALLNLAINAFQHCASNGLGWIRVQSLYLPINHQRPIIICIANPGEMIAENARERLFEPFYTTKPDGTGLGLPIAYQTIIANGGVLELECGDGEIQFWVRLPKEHALARSDSGHIRVPTPAAY